MGTRWGFVRRVLLLPMEVGGGEEGAVEGGEGAVGGDRGVLLRAQEACLGGGEGAQGWLLVREAPAYVVVCFWYVG